MKRLTTFLTIALIFAITSSAFGQKVKIKEGNLKFLKGQDAIKVEFTYENMKVGKMTEEAYIKKNKTKLNKKEAGKGDKWETMWKEDRENRFEPKFDQLFSKILMKKNIDGGSDVEAKYTVIINTYFTEPGYYVGVSSRPAAISTTATFVDSKDHNKVLAVIDMRRAPGNAGMGWDTGERIKEAYAKTGKTLAKFLLKKAFK